MIYITDLFMRTIAYYITLFHIMNPGGIDFFYPDIIPF
jgi:hypothetical protein